MLNSMGSFVLLNWKQVIIFVFCQGVGETNGRRPTNGDLAGFWDMVMIQVISWIQLTSRSQALDFLCSGQYSTH